MNIVKFGVGDTLIMKKKHPCSSDAFRVLRAGSDCRIVCLGCSRDLTLERRALEKMIKKVIPQEGNAE
ncbi:MAG: DUF951 domain-containing protein [Clostridia bacterium]|nr:DUF951 domain-containing protein [Clostridia bacterium]MBP3583006.1 DUF951 domain-containing protein [Clostridia bacterium]MBQ8583218.1 DUF951 domain-containing protein [Clostridia bacterium]